VGLNIVVETADGLEHPTWDPVRRGPDRDVATIIKTLPQLQSEDFEGDPIIRPSDFIAGKEAAPQEAETRSRYLELVELLEVEPQYWIVLSY
jgi:hypothetical protein